MGPAADLASALALVTALAASFAVGLVALLRRRGAGRRGAGATAPRPLHVVAGDLRALAAALDATAPHATHRAATVLAYDDALQEACAMLDVEEHLLRARRRGDADSERRRVEQALERHGLTVR